MAKDKTEYRPRIVDGIIVQKLKSAGALLIEGPKWCGKTTTAKQVTKSALELGKTKVLNNAKLIAINDIDKLLEGETPRLIDEWQAIEELWDTARSEIDERNAFGQFIFTGSAVPPNKEKIEHTGTGRFSRLRMRTMSLYESGESNGTVSLSDLFANKPVFGQSNLSIHDIAYIACRGGFPASLKIKDKDAALNVVKDYIESIANSDLSRVDKITRSSDYVKRIMRSYARFQGEQAALSEIQKDIASIAGDAPDIKTITSYCSALKKIFVIDDVSAWNPNLRSKAAIRTTDTRYYVDPAIAVAALEANPEGLLNDTRTFGFIFETLCMRDLKVYVESSGGAVSRYRDSNGLECDAVVHLYGGAYGFIQIKLGGSQEEIDDAAKKMKTIEANLGDSYPKPSFSAVITGANSVAYRREDGVYVVPIGCLKP